MAVTNYIDRDNGLFSGPKSSGKIRTGFGNGTPVADAVFTDDEAFPIGSQYTDLDDGAIFTKVTAGDNWTENSPVA